MQFLSSHNCNYHKNDEGEQARGLQGGGWWVDGEKLWTESDWMVQKVRIPSRLGGDFT